MGRYRRKREAKARRRPWEFSKKLAAWAVLVATAAAVASYVLAFRDQQTASDVTTTIFTACIGYLVSYAAKSATEKISRNRTASTLMATPSAGPASESTPPQPHQTRRQKDEHDRHHPRH